MQRVRHSNVAVGNTELLWDGLLAGNVLGTAKNIFKHLGLILIMKDISQRSTNFLKDLKFTAGSMPPHPQPLPNKRS